METAAALPGIAVAAIHLPDLSQPCGGNTYARANRVAIRLHTSKPELNPVPAPLSYAMVKERVLVCVGLIQVETAIVVEISDSESPPVPIVIHTGLYGDIPKLLADKISKHDLFLVSAPTHGADVRPVPDVREIHTWFGDQVQEYRDVVLLSRRAQPVNHKQIEPAVVVEVGKLGRPSPKRRAGMGLLGDIDEGAVVVVVPQHVALLHVLVGDVR